MCFLPSLRDLIRFFDWHPPLKRRAIVGCPCGTSVRFAGDAFPQYANVNMKCHGTNGKFQFKTVLDGTLNAKYVCVVNTHQHPRCCPSCNHHFVPWSTWQISQWSCLKCPRCGVRLNRRRDAQIFLMLFVGMFFVASPVLLMLTGFHIAGVIPLELIRK